MELLNGTELELNVHKLRKPELDSSHGSMEEHHGPDRNEREESSGSERGAEQSIPSTLIDTLVERVVEKVREQLAPPPSRHPEIPSASPVTSEGTRKGVNVVHWLKRRESVDSQCKDGADVQYMQYFKQKPYNFTTNTLIAYLCAQASSLSAFVISKTPISGQKPRGRQLNAKVCDSKSAIFRILLSFFVTTFVQTTITQKGFKHSPWF